MPLTAPPTIPLITDPSTFATRAQDWVVWQADELYPFIVETSTLLGLSTETTSVTSNSISVGTKTFTVEAGKGFIAGQSLSIAYTTTPTNRMFAVVTSYNSTTGELVVEVQAIEGSGTYTAWSIALAFNGVIGTDQIDDDAVTTAKIANEAVTYAKIQNVSDTAKILGRKTAAAGDVEECSLSELLDFIGSAAQGDILYRGALAWERLAAGTSGQFLKTLGTGGNPSWGSVGLTLGTPVASTSGSAVDFGSLPSGISQININLNAVSFTASISPAIRIGTGGTLKTTGYLGNYASISTTVNTTLSGTGTSGFTLSSNLAADYTISGTLTLNLVDVTNNIWVAEGIFASNIAGTNINVCSGHVTLAGALDIVRVYGGTFDAGTINISYI